MRLRPAGRRPRRGVPPHPLADSTVAFLLGLGWLGVSVLADTFLYHRFLLEDGSKLLGVLTWLAVPLLTLRARQPRAEPTG